MGSIHVLPEHVIRKISAGEVIERPASVVKELIENSIDAGATSITIEIKKSGKRLIRVIDNGSGMDREDAVKCVEHHATSKIMDESDLWKITSRGFRGEALSSIAAVSRLEIVTKRKADALGTAIKVEGGKVLDTHEAGAQEGTSISVEDLFFNTPVRLKFLKSERTEMTHILDVVTTMALSVSSVSFAVIEDGNEIFHVPAGDGLSQKISSMFGGELAEKVLPCRYEQSCIRISGLLGKPHTASTTRSRQFFFVNKRPVKNPAISFAVNEAYHEVLAPNLYPPVFLFIEVEPGIVDVNIHPTKREVRFSDWQFVQNAITGAVRSCLSSHNLVPEGGLDITGMLKGSEYPTGKSAGQYSGRVKEALNSYLENPQVRSDFFPRQKTGALISARDQELAGTDSGGARVLGNAHNLYIIAEDVEGLLIIDQHAAHERVLYDRLMKEIKTGQVTKQSLLFPVMVEMTKADKLVILEDIEILLKIGFEIEEFDPQTVSVKTVPVIIENVPVAELIQNIAGELKELENDKSHEREIEERLARMSCRKAVMARDRMSFDDMKNLVKDLLATSNPHACPHGRPTMIHLTSEKLAQMFKRTG